MLSFCQQENLCTIRKHLDRFSNVKKLKEKVKSYTKNINTIKMTATKQRIRGKKGQDRIGISEKGQESQNQKNEGRVLV